MGVFPLKQEEKANQLKDDDEQVEALKRTLKKNLMMKLKNVKQKIVLQIQQTLTGVRLEGI